MSNSVQAAREEHWTRTDSWLFWSFGLGMLLENYIFSLSSVATQWVPMPKSLQSLLLAWSPIWLIIGIAVAGPLADRVGRKNTFYTTMALYGLGAIGLAFSNRYWLILLFLAMLLFAAGGEMNTIMAVSHEMMPHKHRGKTMMLELNFINLGGVILGLVALSTAYQHVAFQRAMIAITLLVVLIILFFARRNTPESIRWLESTGQHERARAEIEKYYGWEEYQARQEAARQATERAQAREDGQKRVGMGLKLFTTLTISFAGSAGFGLMTYVLGPHFFPKLNAAIILVATGTGFVSGFFGLWADRWSRKWLLLIGYLGSFIMTLVIWATIPAWSKSLALFWILLIVLNVFVNIGYLTEDTLKGEVWPTKRRGTYTALVRFVSIGLYIATIYITQNFGINAYTMFNALVWVIGLAGAIAWFIGGNETGKGASLDVASGET
ncbi:MFS transporter [Alicyclobacillus mali]|uniref:MFS transporter n=1 Tax=Alicyclobacillus mali (ex Roth et al. 2021) TaxID=1123961 RepID=A0ABS0F1F8_9BACL|nr:MFS transporter [Alicyclobacillus mali (ex Roth et al. 2021)]MBF8377130.1 MFS transporter [Alicyclobacillus mali (ex Roth et al. 2021)]